MPDRKLPSTDQETENTLNDYFSTVFEVKPNEPLPEFEDRTFIQPLEHISITEREFENVVSALNASKRQVPDLFHPKFLKGTKDLITLPLKIIFQNL